MTKLLPSSEQISKFVFERLENGGRFRGEARVTVVNVDGSVQPLKHQLVRHSPDGFEFGYSGSGPAECALNICLLFLPRVIAGTPIVYQDFKEHFISTVDQEKGGEVPAEAMREWLIKMLAEWKV